MPRRMHSDGVIVNVEEGNKGMFECVLCNSRFVSDGIHITESQHKSLVLVNEPPAPLSPHLPPLALELAAIQNALIYELSESDESQKSDKSNKFNRSNNSDNLNEEYDEFNVHLDFSNINKIPESFSSSLRGTEDDDDMRAWMNQSVLIHLVIQNCHLLQRVTGTHSKRRK
ncbi:hypothetical protein DFH28DRAFT_1188691 [Melampsora americana]|nr:hypothetical protein DFH28DRAFT_1188691 [Melampsora americana]